MAQIVSKLVYEGGVGEIVEKKSRFIATIVPVSTEEEALAFIQKTKKQYWDARHNCFAYIIGDSQPIMRCSDDGEPSQTAGKPMLDVLLAQNIYNVVVVVTRYFGGVLLGTGGLVRAYQGAVKAGLAKCALVEKKEGKILEITTDYTGLGKIEYYLREKEIPVLETVYEQNVLLRAVILKENENKAYQDIVEKTNGTAELVWGENVTFAEINKKIEIF